MGSAPNLDVKAYWEKEVCGTAAQITGQAAPRSRVWFEAVERHRYRTEPFIHSIAQFTTGHGKDLLEVGVGAGTDHLQWARAGARCHGVDLTEAAVATTRERLKLYGFESDLRCLDAETLPYPDQEFDIVYSWGVIHHSENPARIIAEIHRVLRTGGEFRGMLYGRRSALAFKLWVRHALLAGRPWRSLADVLWHHLESVGTKAYTQGELRNLFGAFADVRLTPLLTAHDLSRWPKPVAALVPRGFGFFIGIEAKK